MPVAGKTVQKRASAFVGSRRSGIRLEQGLWWCSHSPVRTVLGTAYGKTPGERKKEPQAAVTAADGEGSVC